MPGVNLNLSLPSLSDNLATIVSKTATALSAIQNDLTPKVTAGEININAALPFNGNAATGLGSIQLATGNTPTAAGSVYYLNGEFYCIDSTGTIQLTANGSLNASGFGAIVGDYGGVNPARVTYVAASSQYQFTSSAGVWADLVARSIILEGSAGTVQLGVDAAINTARVANFKSLPTSGVSVLVYNAATSTIEDGGVTQVSNALVSTASIKASALKFSTQVRVVIPACDGMTFSGTGHTPSSGGTYAGVKYWQFAANPGAVVFPIKLPVGAQITGYGARVNTQGTTGHIQVKPVKFASNTESIPDANNTSGIDFTITSNQDTDVTPQFAPSIPVIDNTAQYQLIVQSSTSTPIRLYWVWVEYNIP